MRPLVLIDERGNGGAPIPSAYRGIA
jgi:hypothetical protein